MPKRIPFDYARDFKRTDFRKHPGRYQVGIGEQGVLLVEPYKSEILPFWRFKTPEIAEASAKKIYSLFLAYKKADDFVGMDMARKFLQMGYTRARRYANHANGRKYEITKKKGVPTKKRALRPQAADWATNAKAESARIFYGYYLKARENRTYAAKRATHAEQYG